MAKLGFGSLVAHHLEGQSVVSRSLVVDLSRTRVVAHACPHPGSVIRKIGAREEKPERVGITYKDARVQILFVRRIIVACPTGSRLSRPTQNEEPKCTPLIPRMLQWWR
jgi:hypothetical protein